MTQATTKKTTNWMPAVRHRRSQSGVLMRVSLLLSTFQGARSAEGIASKYDADAREHIPGIPAWDQPLTSRLTCRLRVCGVIVPAHESTRIPHGNRRPACRGVGTLPVFSRTVPWPNAGTRVQPGLDRRGAAGFGGTTCQGIRAAAGALAEVRDH